MASKDYDKILTRLVLILSKLSANERPTTADLAKEFNVTIRTIQQDVYNRLISFPIIKDQNGRLCFIDGYSLDRSMFDTEEMILLSLGISQFEKIDGLSGVYEKVYKKILHSRFMNPYYIKQEDIEEIDFDSEVNNSLEEAIAGGYLVEVKIGNVLYELEPYKISNFDGIWYLFARSLVDGFINTFLLSNIESVALLTKRFDYDHATIVNQIEKLNTAWFSHGDSKRVKVLANKKIAHYFQKREFFEGQEVIEAKENGDLVLSFEVTSYDEFDNIVKSWLPDIKVLEPKEYRERLVNELATYLSEQKTE
jgi:predicted DNA-binding transcriptional regulator YafY